jgi:superfamily II DNA/RNA helicase
MTAEPSFESLGVPDALTRVLAGQGIGSPFPIQIGTLPDTLGGRDVLGRGKTGSGKTLAFSIPLVARLAGGHRRPSKPTGLVLAPTRELATQITAVIEPLAAALGMNVTTIFGGVSQSRQVSALRAGVDIVVACPGRLEDLMKQRHIALDAVQITVLDEADHMADLGFMPGVPAGGQRLLFSATLDNGVDKLVQRFLRNPITHSVDEIDAPPVAMTHHVYHVSGAQEKTQLVHRLASGTGRRILFMRTKHQARKLAKQLTDAGVPSVDLHGNLSQPARDRNLAAFSSGDARVLVATDIAARGVHVDDVELVVHVDPPVEHKAYLHRSGRTARAGSAGDVVTVVLPEQRRDTQQLLRKAGITAQPQQVRADSESVLELVGEIAPHREPPVRPATPPSSRGGNRGAGGSGRGNGAPFRGNAAGGRTGASSGGARRGGGPRRPRSGSGRAQTSS